MGKNIFTTIITLIAVSVISATLTSCTKKSKDSSLYAKEYIPLIIAEKDGTYDYSTPNTRVVKCYPLNLLDSVKALPRTPATRVVFRLTEQKDSFFAYTHAPTEILLSGMDSIRFIYPPQARSMQLPKKVWWNTKDIPALSDDYYVLAFKAGKKELYTKLGKRIKSKTAEKILQTAQTKPSSEK